MGTREDKIEKNDIEKLTEEIKNLRLELKTSNESIIALSETAKKLSGNSTCKTFNPSKGRKTEERTNFSGGRSSTNHKQDQTKD